MAYVFNAGSSGFGLEPIIGDYVNGVGMNPSEIVSQDQADDGGTRELGGRHYEGRPINVAGLPTNLKREPARLDKLKDVYSAPKDMFYVSENFKEIVEKFEPGIHQFFPYTLTLKGNTRVPFYLFNICQRISAMAEDHTVPPLDMTKRRRYRRINDGSDILVFSKSAIGNRKLWAEMHLGHYWVGDDLFAALREARLSGVLNGSHVAEV